MTEDERAIRELVDRWMAATRDGDLRTVLEMMSDDVMFLTPGREPFGKEEFRAASMASNDAEIDGQALVQELEVAGDWAWLRNQINLTVTADRAAVHRSGCSLTIFRKGDDGRWRLYRDANLVS